jgi:hypothetical protein
MERNQWKMHIKAINHYLASFDLLQTAYGRCLTERYVLSPVERIYEKNLQSDRRVIDMTDYCEKGDNLRFSNNNSIMNGWVKIFRIASINTKGRYVDVMA